MNRVDQRGFTILELMIATAVFSVMLLLISSAMLQIGRIYYKGIITAKTQEAARAITDDVSRAIQFSGGAIGPMGASNYYCVGGRRYSIAFNQKVQDNPVSHGLVADTPPSNCLAAGGLNMAVGGPTGDIEELLGVNMRLNVFEIEDAGADNLYSVRVRVVYGDDDLLCSPTRDNCNSPSPMGVAEMELVDDLTCKLGSGSQFCAVSELKTHVQKRLQ